MDLKNRLTKTPYLVLFIVLIAIGVGTASALITITLAGDVVITGFLDMTGDKISNLGTPTTNTDAATKDYVDSTSGGILGFYSVFNGTNLSNVIEAFCDPGDKVTGGGAGISGSLSNPAVIAISRPFGDDGWHVVYDVNSVGTSIQAIAVCADYAPEHPEDDG